MPRETETPAVDWRAEAEARGRAAFEAATAEPQPSISSKLEELNRSPKGKKESR